MRPQLLALMSLTLSFPAAAWDVRTDSEGDVVRWARPVEMVLDSSAAELLHEGSTANAISAAIQHLDDATPFLELSLRVAAAKPIGYVVGARDNQNSILVLEDWPYAEGTLAVTLVTLNARTNELLDADIAFNLEGHHFRVLPDVVKDDRRFDDVQNTITHELGHVLGLMHNTAHEDLVMYPSAPPGETLKRNLKSDDRDGLLSLYGTAVEPVKAALAPLVGCSATSTPPASLLILALGLVLLRFSRVRARHLALAACVPTLALAAAPLPDSITGAKEVALVRVVARQALQHPTNPGLIVTVLTIAPVECLKGACTPLEQIVVAGGRLGDLEQIAVHEPVPLVGQRVLVTRSTSRPRVLWVDAEVQQSIIASLRALAGSTETPGAAVPPTPRVQVPAITP